LGKTYREEGSNVALLINPYTNTEGVADTLKHAIEMSPEEKAHRIARRHMHLAEHNIYKWLAAIFATLEHIQGASDGATLTAVAPQGCGLGAGTVREIWAVRVVPPLALLAIPHTLDTLTGWTMDRYIGHSVSLWRPEQMGHSTSLSTRVKHPRRDVTKRRYALDKSPRPYYIFSLALS